MTELNKPTNAPGEKTLTNTEKARLLVEKNKKVNRIVKETKERFKRGMPLNIDKGVEKILQSSGVPKGDWEKYRTGIRVELISRMNRPQIDAFRKNDIKRTAQEAIKSPSKLEGLKAKIQRAAEHFTGNKKETKSLIDTLIKMVGATSFLGKFLTWAFKKKPKTAPKKTATKRPKQRLAQAPSRTTSQTPSDKEKLLSENKKLTELFKKNFSPIEESVVKSDLANLRKVRESGKPIDISKYILDAAKPGSRISRLREAIKKALPNKIFKFRLADLMFQHSNVKEKDFKTMLAIIENKDGKYKLEKTPSKTRAFLDKVNQSKDRKKTLETFKK